jgi:hypothetical protein
MARSCLDQVSKACPLCPGKSVVALFGYGESVSTSVMDQTRLRAKCADREEELAAVAQERHVVTGASDRRPLLQLPIPSF